jgi:hypothetical protein
VLLWRAREDFTDAKQYDPDHFKARRAVEKVTQRYKGLSSQKVTDRWAPLSVAALAFTILVLIQSSFFAHRPSINLKEEYYVLLTFGSLMFVAAAFYLPQVLKLKVAGVELEKSSVEKIAVPTTLGISRDAFSLSVSTLMPSDFLASRPRQQESRPSGAAATGARDVDPKRERHGSAQEAAEVGPKDVKQSQE